ncbi:MAG: haloacid dehalogenase type II [Desulfuromonadales bacterium]|nr:haloacid dehalogenase type II [Desulfuromonadales bacterium]
MPATLAFDVYGTLIDTTGIVTALEKLVGDASGPFSDLWRSKQLEYSFRRGLMQNYQDFSVCTRHALDFCCETFQVELCGADRNSLLEAYRYLPAFKDARQGLERLKTTGCRLFAFSNGKPDDVRNLMQHAGIAHYLEGVVSTDEIKSFKPNPAVYAHFLRQAGACGADAWLISGNPFDVIGAISAGMRGAWVKRAPQAVFDPWEIQPTLTVGSILELCDVLEFAD